MKSVVISMEELVPLIQLQLQQGGSASLIVTGNSMSPMLQHRRDTVFLQPPEAECKKGDLILYRRDNGKYILHRIVRCTGPGAYICSGDNQWEPEVVSHQQVIAKVDHFCRKGKTYSPSSRGYRFYVWLWVGIFPIRRPILAVRRLLGKLRARIRKNSKTGGK